jgi:hypothetical protein
MGPEPISVINEEVWPLQVYKFGRFGSRRATKATKAPGARLLEGSGSARLGGLIRVFQGAPDRRILRKQAEPSAFDGSSRPDRRFLHAVRSRPPF